MSPAGNVSLSSPNYMFAICTFLVTVFLALMNLKFRPMDIPSVFETHSVLMPMFVATIVVYTANFRTSFFHEAISTYIGLVSGSLGPVLLALVLFPGYLGRLILLLWAIYFVKLTYDACRKLHATSSVSNFLNQLFRGGHNNEENFLTSSTTASNHAILSFLIAALLALLPLKFHSVNASAAPFETYKAILLKFLMTMLLYAVALAIQIKLGSNNSSYHLVVSKISLLLGSLGPVCLVLILVPGLGYFALLIWSLFLVKLIYEACQKLHQLYWAIHQLYRAISIASDLFNELLGRNRSEYQNQRNIILPV